MRKLWKNCQKKFKIQIEGEIEMFKKNTGESPGNYRKTQIKS